MSSLVLELQADALDDSVPILNLLRKARTVSSKLNVSTMDQWLDWEMNGYKRAAQVPSYREVFGKVICLNPYRGYIPLDITDTRLKRIVSLRKLLMPMSQLTQFTGGEAGRSLLFPYTPEQSEQLQSMMEIPFEPSLEVPVNLIDGVIASVRNKILDFALDLEKQGILGEGMSFSKQEKLVASQIHYNVNVENMHGSQIQQGTTNSTQNYTQTTDLTGIAAFVETLLPAIGEINSSAEREQIRSDLETIRSQIKAPTPKLGIIRECLTSVKTTLEGAAGNVIAAQFLPLIPTLLASIVN